MQQPLEFQFVHGDKKPIPKKGGENGLLHHTIRTKDSNTIQNCYTEPSLGFFTIWGCYSGYLPKDTLLTFSHVKMICITLTDV